jgi:CheY-like chemotaxis protein
MHSLRWKFFVLFVGLGLSSSLVMYIPYSRYIKAAYQEKIADVLKMIDTDYHDVLSDPDKLVRLGNERSEQYWNIVHAINNIAHINDIEYIYYVQPEGETFRFVFSSEETPDTPLDEVFSQYETSDISQAMEIAYKTGTLQISQTPYTDVWGTFVSAYIPITYNGSIVGILGADYEISKIRGYEFRAQLSLIVSVIIAIALALLLSMSLIRPIKALEQAAGLIADMDFGVHIGKFRKDEIGSMQKALVKIRDNLKAAFEQLEQSNVMLEAKVQERTLELEEQTKIAVQASRAKFEFLAAMSHELRTPLNAVIGLAQIELQNKPGGNLPASTLKHITQIHQSGLHLLEMINDILNISKVEAGNFEPTPAVKKENAVTHARFAGKKALVVDDLPMNLLVARGLLLPYGMEVDTASSGNEAIKKIKDNNYDLILMDHMMPEMDGVETMVNLKKLDNFNAPVVALTANALQGMREFYLERGFQDYLSKPISPQALDETVNKWIRNTAPPLPISISMELDAQRLDKLNHFRAAFAFDSGREIDAEYFEKFTALIESVDVSHSPLKEQAVLLAAAGRQRDAQKIRETLPAFCEALQSNADIESAETEIVNEILQRLKNALQEGDTQKAGRIVTELGAIKLSPEGRELYFTLYDYCMEDNTQKALERIKEWLKY